MQCDGDLIYMSQLNKETKRILTEIVKDLQIHDLVDDNEMPQILLELEKRGCKQDYEFLYQDVNNFITELVIEEKQNIDAYEDAEREDQLEGDRLNIC